MSNRIKRPKTKQFNVRLPEELIAKAQKARLRDAIGWPELLSKLLARYLADRENLY